MAYPEHLNRWLVLVEWLLAVPHLIIVGLLVGGSSAASTQQNEWAYRSSGGPITLLALVAVVMLAFSGNYPRSLFDLLMGLNRWVCRVWAYMILMTDEYPPVPAGRRRRRSDDRPGLAGSARKSPLTRAATQVSRFGGEDQWRQ